ncbi:hypothetical protein M3Y99_01632200 [Aphelenchoides fujianensis]|nr:hypothetical protein M3Y99_01632200 [Aphelenchoides fujianensis]
MPAQMRKLETLSLARNKLIYLPSIFRDFSRLRTLDLSGNPFESDQLLSSAARRVEDAADALVCTPSKTDLSLYSSTSVCWTFAGSSELSTIHPNAFGFGQEGPKARALRVLNVENCGLMKLDSRTFPWTQLEEVHLGGKSLELRPIDGVVVPRIFHSPLDYRKKPHLRVSLVPSRNGAPLGLRHADLLHARLLAAATPAQPTDGNRWVTTRQPRFPFWFAESTRSPYTDELGGEVDEWWARDVMPTLRSAPHHPAVYFAAGAIASAVVLLAGCCCCQAVGCCFRRCCCPKPRSSWGVRNEAAGRPAPDPRRRYEDRSGHVDLLTINRFVF